MRIHRLENPVQRYAWGSVDGISDILGIANPGGGPLAEVWMGAHPCAPSTAMVDGEKCGLDELVRRAPSECLGPAILKALGPTLPFLFKILSAGTPLSIQAHPNKRRAELGYERENQGGIPVDAPERCYRDSNHKPEMVVALSRFELVCGFRPIAEILENLRLVAPNEFGRSLERLERDPSRGELSDFLHGLISANQRTRDGLLAAVSRHITDALEAKTIPVGGEGAFQWVMRIMEIFPGDVGAIFPLVLNHVVLEPGEAAFIAPGELHAHLKGTCLEIMANSDNVIRGALTSKFVDLDELVSVLSFNPGNLPIVRPLAVAPCEYAYPVYVPDFRLSRISVGSGRRYTRVSRGPEILLCVSGAAEISCPGEVALPLGRGESAFVAADACDYAIAAETSEAVVFRASVPGLP